MYLEFSARNSSKAAAELHDREHQANVQAALSELNSVQLEEKTSLSSKLPVEPDGSGSRATLALPLSIAPTRSLGLEQPRPVLGDVEAKVSVPVHVTCYT